LTRLELHASINAEPFYAALGYLIALLGGEAGLRCGEMMSLE
jgi:hypothetical protein